MDYKRAMKEELLNFVKREGVEDLFAYMESIGFFEAPASGGHHLHCEGGLAEHSWNVYSIAVELNYSFDAKIPLESIAVASLLHDLGKCGDYGKQMYVKNVLKSGSQSDAKPYKRNSDLLPLDHATRSLCIINRFMDLTEDEEYAIRYHDGLYVPENAPVKGNETPLYIILHTADLWSSRITERKE